MLFKAILAFNIMIVLKVFKMNQCYDATQQNYLHLVWKRTPFSSLLSYNSIAARLLQNLSKAIDSRSLLLFPVIRYFVRFENKFDLYSFFIEFYFDSFEGKQHFPIYQTEKCNMRTDI